MASSVFLNAASSTLAPTASVIPTADNSYDLGSASFQWRSIYLGTSAVLADAATISWSDLVLSRASANLLQLASGDSFQTVDGTLTAKRPGIITTSTDGVILQNATAATVGVPVQVSPRTRWTGTAWDGDDLVSRSANFFVEVLPISGGTVGGSWKLGFLDPITSGVTYAFTVDSNAVNTATYSFPLSNATFGGSLYVGATSYCGFNGRALLNSPADSVITLVNNAAADFNRLQFGGTTSSFPALKRSSTSLIARLADDSADTGLAMSTIVQSGKTTTYNAVATAGWGVPAIYGYGDITGATGVTASIATYTVGVADGTFEVSANCLVTTSTNHTFSLDVTYTDEGSNARTMVLPVTILAGTFATTGLITNVTGVGPYTSPVMTIRAKAATAITVRTSAGGTYTSVVYNARGSIKQIS